MSRVLIIGGGVVGLSTAYYCLQRGHEVTVLDRGSPEDANCSYGNAGLIVPSHFVPLAAPGMVAMGLKWMLKPDSPFYIKPRLDADLISWGWKFYRSATRDHVRRSAPLLRDLNLATSACFDEFARKHGNDFDLEKRGCFCLCKTQERLDHEAEIVEQARELGLKADLLDAKQTAAMEPSVRMEIVGSVFFHDDSHISSWKFMGALKREVGTHVRWDTKVTGWKIKGARIDTVQTTQGDFTADEVVLCAGSWSSTLLKLPLQAGKGYSLTLPEPPQLPRIPMILTEARVAVTPMGGNLRFGGTMEIAGLNEDVNPIRIQGIIRSVPKYFPHFASKDFEGIKPWRGLRPCSPDGMPYIGRTRRFKNLLVGTGHAMMGLSLGP
ncbi:MAG TPA: FAD-dependent oxidoreductase, partial [Verrucomicrobiae bacterium]|nr:FAD-dependent oxidoreductase [Verrucomicrobiae bacterium]